MKICVIGLGSIGKRHVMNMVKVLGKKCNYQIDALRSSPTALNENLDKIICRQYYSPEDLPDDYDIVFVTNPTSFHYETIKMAIPKAKHMFIEKPVFDSMDYDIDALPLKKKGIYYVACPLRHKSIIRYVKHKILTDESIISARIISSSYLPSWRKNVDYRNIYSARKSMGGGVSRDLIHEWDYAVYLFGNPQKIFHLQGHVSDLEIDSDDLSVYIAKYQKMFLEIHLDYIGQKTERTLQLFTNDKRIDVDLIADEICVYANNDLLWKQQFENEDYYINELRYFLDCVEKGKNNENTIADAFNTLRIALAEE